MYAQLSYVYKLPMLFVKITASLKFAICYDSAFCHHDVVPMLEYVFSWTRLGLVGWLQQQSTTI